MARSFFDVGGHCFSLFALLFLSTNIACGHDLYPKLSARDVTVILGETSLVDFSLYGNTNHEVINITFQKQIPTLVFISPIKIRIDTIDVGQPIDFQWALKITGLHPGYLEVVGKSVPHIKGFEKIFMRITIALHRPLIYLSQVVGWIYFVAWCVSFYPQIYDNYQRKDVTGLNYDYLSFNILGSALYCAFNLGLYACPLIENEYLRRNVRGLNPVLINDVLFSIHALAATLFTAFQCYIYQSSGQKISQLAKVIHSVFFLCIVMCFGVAASSLIHWLDFLYFCSYVKLVITLIKYIPQALMNYRRKSTDGWSIGCIHLDIIGGVFSILQMLINAYNHDDWASISGDPTKMGLGIFSMSFDIFFMLQHYVFYRDSFFSLRQNESNLEQLSDEKDRLNEK